MPLYQMIYDLFVSEQNHLMFEGDSDTYSQVSVFLNDITNMGKKAIAYLAGPGHPGEVENKTTENSF